jgi:hypothetical protein
VKIAKEVLKKYPPPDEHRLTALLGKRITVSKLRLYSAMMDGKTVCAQGPIVSMFIKPL